MLSYHYTVEAIAAPTQSDAGKTRKFNCTAYADQQAMAWAQEWFRDYATVTRVSKKIPTQVTKQYVVQTFRGTTSEVAEFSSLEFARKHVGLNPCSLIFRREQVSRINEDNWICLKDGDSTPLDC